jgi:hypothetical protein
MNKENGVETLTNSDKDKANTLSDFFSSVFTTETTDNYPSLEGINISYNMDTLVIDEEKEYFSSYVLQYGLVYIFLASRILGCKPSGQGDLLIFNSCNLFVTFSSSMTRVPIL